MSKPLEYWAQAWRFTFTFVATLALITLAANQIAGLGFRYGKSAGFNEAIGYCQQPTRAQQEDVTWRTRESL